MKAVSSLSAAALALGLVAGTASAQVAGLPVNYAPVGTGVTIHGEFGRGVNNSSGKITSVGGGVTLGMPMFQVGAALSYWGLSDTDPQEISFGAHGAYKLPLGPATPVSLAIAAGLGYVSLPSVGGDVTNLTIPIGLTASVDVPSTSVALTPWLSPQLRMNRASAGGASSTNTDFGVSGGLNVTLPAGVGFSAMLDYDNASEGFLVGAGVFFGINTGAGM